MIFSIVIAREADGTDQFSRSKRAQYEILRARVAEPFCEPVHGCRAMILGRGAERERLTFERFQAKVPERLGILRSQGSNFEFHRSG
jgi:hypothetical protein